VAQEGLARGTTEGKEGIIMGDGIQVSRVGERFSTHTQAHARSRRHGSSEEAGALRQRLIDAIVEVVAEGGDPRLP
jgi:hypothetical protein